MRCDRLGSVVEPKPLVSAVAQAQAVWQVQDLKRGIFAEFRNDDLPSSLIEPSPQIRQVPLPHPNRCAIFGANTDVSFALEDFAVVANVAATGDRPSHPEL